MSLINMTLRFFEKLELACNPKLFRLASVLKLVNRQDLKSCGW